MTAVASAAIGLSLMPAARAMAQVTTGFDFNVDATLDTDGNSRWEDTVGTTGFDFELAGSVTRNTGVSALPGIGAAYDFVGGSTGNVDGALLSSAGTTTRRSFDDAPGDWSNNHVTIEIWFKPGNLTPTPTNGQILFEDGGGTGFGFFVDNSELRLRKAGGGGDVASNISAISGEFIQAVGTYDVSAGAMELFVNGLSVGTDTPGGNDWSGGDYAAVGTRGQSNVGGIGSGQQNTESFDGQIAIFRVYDNQILTLLEVGNNYTAISGVSLFAEFYWDGTEPGNWGDAGPTHWLDDTGAATTAAPTSSDQAFVTDGTVNVAATRAVLSLDIGATAGPPAAVPPIPTIDDPILNVNDTLTVGNSTSVGANGTLSVNSGGALVTGTIDAVLGSAVNLNSGGSLTVNTSGTVDQLNIDSGVTTAGTFTATNTALTAGNTIEHTSGTATLSNLAITGTGLTKDGNGTVHLNTANTYLGATTVNQGVLSISNGGALGATTAGTVVNSGGQLRLGTNNITVNSGESINISGNGPGNGGAIYAQAGNNINIDGPVSLDADSRINVAAGASARLRLRGGLALNDKNLTAIVAGSGERLEINNAPITGTGNLRLEGDGITELRVNSPGYSGSVDVTNGIADTYGNDQGLGVGTINVDGDATLRFRNGVDLVNNVTLNGTAGGGTGQTQGRLHNENNTNSLQGTLAVNSNSRIDVNGGSTLTLAGVVSGGGNIEKTDAGRLVLSNGGNTFTGPLNIMAGTVEAARLNALGSSSGVTVSSGGTLDLSAAGTYTTAVPINISGGGAGGTGALVSSATTKQIDSPINVAGTTIGNSTAATTFTINGPINLPNSGDLTFTGPGDIIVNSGFGNGPDMSPSGRFVQVKNNGTATRRMDIGEIEAFATGDTPSVDHAGDNQFLNPSIDLAYSGSTDGASVYAKGADSGFSQPHGTDDDGRLIDARETDGAGTWSSNGVGNFVTIDLGNTFEIGAVRVHQRNGCCQDRLRDFSVNVFEDDGAGDPGALLASGSYPGQPPNERFGEIAFGINNNVIKTGAGTTAFAGANTYNGTTSVEEGMLVAANSSALGIADGTAATGTSVASGATLALQGGIAVGDEHLTLAGAGATLRNISGNNSMATQTVVVQDSSSAADQVTIQSDAGSLTLGSSGDFDLNYSQLNVVGAGNTTITQKISAQPIGTIVGSSQNALDAYAYDVSGNNGDQRLGDIGRGTAPPGPLGPPVDNALFNSAPISHILIDSTDRIDYRNDNDFRNGDAGLNAQGFAVSLDGLPGLNQNDNFATAFYGQLNVPDLLGGGTPYNVEFGTNRGDDPVQIYVDLDQDGTFEHGEAAGFNPGGTSGPFGEMILNRDCCGNGFRTISLAPGSYDYLAVQLERGGGSQIEPTIDLTPDALGRRTVQPGQMAGLFTISDIIQAPAQYHLIKNGTGTLRLTGDNDYDGETLITAGTLLIDGTTSGQGTYTVQSGATLGGGGTIGLAAGESIIFEGGSFLAPGTSVGTLTVDVDGNVTMEAGSTYLWELGPAENDVLNVPTVTLTLEDWTLQLIDAGGEILAGETYYLFTGFSALELAGGSDPANFNAVITSLDWDTSGLSIGRDSQGLFLQAAPIPEPSTLALAVLALLGLGLFGWRRKKSK